MYIGTSAYYDYLKGKTAVLVGPAGYLKGSKNGRFIDSFDIIVRVNLSCPVPLELREDIGSTTNVVYHVIMRNEYIRAAPTLFRKHTPEEIRSWQDNGMDWIVTKQSYLHAASKDFKKVVGTLNWTTLTNQERSIMKKYFYGTVPNTGVIAMWHMLKSEIKSLHVMGIDFYATGYYEGYNNFTAAQAKKAIIPPGGQMKRAWGQLVTPTKNVYPVGFHNTAKQLKGLGRLLKQDNRFSVDSVLTKLIRGNNYECNNTDEGTLRKDTL